MRIQQRSDVLPGTEKVPVTMNKISGVHYVLLVINLALLYLCMPNTDAEVGLYDTFHTLARTSVVWLLLPLLNYFADSRSSFWSSNSSDRAPIRRYILLVLTIALANLCFVNLDGERAFNVTWSAELDTAPLSHEALATIALIWLSVPILSFVDGIRTEQEKRLRMALVIACYYFIWMLYFALNGTDTDEFNYDSARLYGRPFGILLFSPVVLYGELCLRRFERWLALRSTPSAGFS